MWKPRESSSARGIGPCLHLQGDLRHFPLTDGLELSSCPSIPTRLWASLFIYNRNRNRTLLIASSSPRPLHGLHPLFSLCSHRAGLDPASPHHCSRPPAAAPGPGLSRRPAGRLSPLTALTLLILPAPDHVLVRPRFSPASQRGSGPGRDLSPYLDRETRCLAPSKTAPVWEGRRQDSCRRETKPLQVFTIERILKN